MAASDSSNQNQHLPVYNIKVASRMLGLLPVTLRAWERRYGMPTPQRGDQGYRLYSEYDLLTLRWLKSQIDAGMNISRAVEYLQELRGGGNDPARTTQTGAVAERSASVVALAEQFYHALRRFDDEAAGNVMRRAFALYSIDQVLLDIVQPTLVEIGDAWHRGELPIAVEHFATQFCMQHMMAMLAASVTPFQPGLIVAAGAPGEQHQIGLLMLVVMLRWRGWNVKYLGPDLTLDRLEEALMQLCPQALIFTATRVEAAMNLAGLPRVLASLHEPLPLVILGGQAFRELRLPDDVPALYLQGHPSDTVQTIERLMHTPPAPGKE